MELQDIKDPAFLKDMSDEECRKLADEIRSFLISSVSKTGGHLASNLGVVELTIALHKVFHSPEDKIFFDVGHQCYTHKILTGRVSQFDTLRQYGGISGFEKRCESEHDVWEAGHSSTSLSAALGMAVARDLNGENYHVVPVIGDGAMESGMALEALNDIGEKRKRIIIVFNDNGMSISRNVGSLHKSFAKLRIAEGYTGLKHGMKSSLRKSRVGKKVLSELKGFKDAVKKSVVDAGVFGEFGLDYLGPVDGHDISQLVKALDAAKEKSGPVVVHVITKKGKGYEPCEEDEEGIWHGVGPFDPQTGQLDRTKPEDFASWSSVFSSRLEILAERNPDIIAITPAMKIGSKLEEFFRKYPDRSFDTGIAEEHAATFAAGLAVSGKRPYLCVYSTFLQRCYDQINHDICRMDLPVVIGIDRAGLVGNDGSTHHGVFDIGILRCLPHIIICEPKDAKEAGDLLALGFSQDHPFAIRYPRGNTKKMELAFSEPLLEVGSWEVIGDLSEQAPVICTYGNKVSEVLRNAEKRGKKLTVINCRFFKPLDEKVLNRLSELNRKVTVYETDMKAGGLASAISEWMLESGKTFPMECFGIPDQYIEHGDIRSLEKEAGIDTDTVLDKVLE